MLTLICQYYLFDQQSCPNFKGNIEDKIWIARHMNISYIAHHMKNFELLGT